MKQTTLSISTSKFRNSTQTTEQHGSENTFDNSSKFKLFDDPTSVTPLQKSAPLKSKSYEKKHNLKLIKKDLIKISNISRAVKTPANVFINSAFSKQTEQLHVLPGESLPPHKNSSKTLVSTPSFLSKKGSLTSRYEVPKIWPSKNSHVKNKLSDSDLINSGSSEFKLKEYANPGKSTYVFDKVKQVILDCDELNKEISKFEKKLQSTGEKYNRQVSHIQFISQEQTKNSKDFWKTNEDFIRQRAKMNKEIADFRTRVQDKRKEAIQRRKQTDTLDDYHEFEPFSSNSIASNEEDEINQIILKTPYITSKKILSRSPKTDVEYRIKQMKRTVSEESSDFGSNMLVPSIKPNNYVIKSSFSQDFPQLKKSVNKRFTIKKGLKTEVSDYVDEDDFHAYELNSCKENKIDERGFSCESKALSNSPNFLPKADRLIESDIKRFKQVFSARNKQNKMNNFKMDFSSFKKSSLQQRNNKVQSSR